VTILDRNAEGTLSVKSTATSSQKRKSTKGLGLMQKIVRTGAELGTGAAGSHFARHKKSNDEENDRSGQKMHR
jgi:hypothetical protein